MSSASSSSSAPVTTMMVSPVTYDADSHRLAGAVEEEFFNFFEALIQSTFRTAKACFSANLHGGRRPLPLPPRVYQAIILTLTPKDEKKFPKLKSIAITFDYHPPKREPTKDAWDVSLEVETSTGVFTSSYYGLRTNPLDHQHINLERIPSKALQHQWERKTHGGGFLVDAFRLDKLWDALLKLNEEELDGVITVKIRDVFKPTLCSVKTKFLFEARPTRNRSISPSPSPFFYERDPSRSPHRSRSPRRS